MQTFIVDGYNLIHAIPRIEELLDESLESARTGLIQLFSGFKRSRGDVGDIYIVFDGRSDNLNDEETLDSGIKIVYTHSSKEADSKIVEIIKESPRPELITVVSNDNFLYNNARSLGARIKTVREFCRMLK